MKKKPHICEMDSKSMFPVPCNCAPPPAVILPDKIKNALRMAWANSCYRAHQTRRKWTGSDQATHEALKAAMLAAGQELTPGP